MTQDSPLGDLAELWTDSPDAPREPPRTRRHRRIAGIVIAAIVAGALLGSGGYAAWALATPTPDPVIEAAAPTAPTLEATAVVQPQSGGAGVIVSGATAYLGATSGTRFAATDPDSAYPLASITKLITALVILDAHPIGDGAGPTITFSKADHDLYDEYFVQGATVAAMPTGSSQSLRDALASMIVPSAANYAEALTRWAFGSDSAFREAARAWLDARGLANTVVVEPTGMSTQNVTTASDMLLLGQIAAADPVVSEVAARPSTQLADGTMAYTTNGLLGQDGITGLKSGNIGANTYALLYTATLSTRLPEPLTVVGVMLGGASREHVDASVRATLESIQANARVETVGTAGTKIGEISTAWGSSASLVLAEDAEIVVWGAPAVDVTLDMSAPTRYLDGEAIGTVTWTAGPETETVDVVIDGAISPASAIWRLTHPDILAGQHVIPAE